MKKEAYWSRNTGCPEPRLANWMFLFVWVFFFFPWSPHWEGKCRSGKSRREEGITFEIAVGFEFKKIFVKVHHSFMRKEPQKQAAKSVPDVYLQVSLVAASRPQPLPS